MAGITSIQLLQERIRLQSLLEEINQKQIHLIDELLAGMVDQGPLNATSTFVLNDHVLTCTDTINALQRCIDILNRVINSEPREE